MLDRDVETIYENGRWLTRIHGVGGAMATFDTKDDAIDHAHQVATERGVEHIIKNQDGTTENEKGNRGPRLASPHDISD